MSAVRDICKSAFALALLAASCSSVATANLSMADLIGHWCGDSVNYTFKPGQLIVTPLRGQTLTHGLVTKIYKVEGRRDRIDVYWVPDNIAIFTRFEFSADKNRLIQLAEVKGDKGPRRIFRRCQ